MDREKKDSCYGLHFAWASDTKFHLYAFRIFRYIKWQPPHYTFNFIFTF